MPEAGYRDRNVTDPLTAVSTHTLSVASAERERNSGLSDSITENTI
jgi:hypothetical protein